MKGKAALAYVLGLAASFGFCESKPPPKQWSWEPDMDSEPWRTERQLTRKKRKHASRQARKKRRGY